MKEFNLTEAQIETIKEARYNYEIEQVLAELLGKDRINSIDIEPYLETLVNEKQFLGHSINDMSLSVIIALLNEKYGNLCYLAYRQEGDLPEDHVFYENKWGELLEVCKTKIDAFGEDEEDDTCDSWMGLGSSIQMKFTPFNDKDYSRSFADEAYQNAINTATTTSEIMSMASNHLREEYYQNEDLFDQLAARAFELAKTIYDYSSICFDDNENCLFKDTPYFRQAAVKAAEFRHGQDWAWDQLKAALENEGEDVDEIIKESMQNFDTTRTYKFQKATMVTDIHYYELELSGEMAKLYYEDEDAFWEKFEEEDLEGEWDFVNDRVGDENNTFKIKH